MSGSNQEQFLNCYVIDLLRNRDDFRVVENVLLLRIRKALTSRVAVHS